MLTAEQRTRLICIAQGTLYQLELMDDDREAIREAVRLAGIADIRNGHVVRADAAAVSASVGAGSREGEGAQLQEAIALLKEFGHVVAGSAGMVSDRITVHSGCDYWYKTVLPWLNKQGAYSHHVAADTGEAAPAAAGGESLRGLLAASEHDIEAAGRDGLEIIPTLALLPVIRALVERQS